MADLSDSGPASRRGSSRSEPAGSSGWRRRGDLRPLAGARDAGRARGRTVPAAALVRLRAPATTSASRARGSSAGCFRSTACSAPRRSRSGGTRCEAGRSARADGRLGCPRSPSSRSPRSHCCGRTTCTPARTCSPTSCCPSPCSSRSSPRAVSAVDDARAGGDRRRARRRSSPSSGSSRRRRTSSGSSRPASRSRTRTAPSSASPRSSAIRACTRATSCSGSRSSSSRCSTGRSTRSSRSVDRVLFAGVWFSYSQSSMAALFVVTLALAVVAGDTQPEDRRRADGPRRPPRRRGRRSRRDRGPLRAARSRATARGASS